MAAKFKKGDVVRILENRLEPRTVNKVGVITRVHQNAETGEPLYRVRLYDKWYALRGVAEEYCLEKLGESTSKFLKEHPGAKVLDLSLTYHWYDEIEAGRKPEEYRSNTPFYRSRLMCPESSEEVWKHYDAIRFRRGRFGKRTMLVEHKGTRLGVGNPEWGAPKDRKVFCLMLGDILEKN